MPLKKVCVFAGSSRQCDPEFLEAAATLGRELAQARITVVYGGGAVGAMGYLADAALGEGGSVVGVLPRFMYDLEWGHGALSELHLVDDLHERRRISCDLTFYGTRRGRRRVAWARFAPFSRGRVHRLAAGRVKRVLVG